MSLLEVFLYIAAFAVFIVAVAVVLMVFYFVLEWVWKKTW